MTYELCKIIIEDGIDNNPFMTKELMQLQIIVLKSSGEITEEQATELNNLLAPNIEIPVEEPQI